MGENQHVREIVTRAVQQALEAESHRTLPARDEAASQLVAHPPLWPLVSQAALVRTDEEVASLWARNWRPADAVRAVRRTWRTAETALAVDLIAAEARRYPAAAFDRRWQEQLRELDANAWWGRDRDYLSAFGDRHRLDRFDTASKLLAVLHLWRRLPHLGPLGPIPGQQEPASLSEPVPGEPKMLGRIRALLAKAESTDYPEEAEALSAKAQELMARHSIDTALLSARSGGSEAPGAIRIGVDNPYEQPKALLLDAVAAANRCRAVWDKYNGHCTVVGFDGDLDAVELLYTSLLVQATTAMNHAPVQHRSRTRAFRKSFLIAYAERIRHRLSAAAQAVVSAEPEDLLPVLATRDAAVADQTRRLFPKTRAGRTLRADDPLGWAHGLAAADSADLGRSTALPR